MAKLETQNLKTKTIKSYLAALYLFEVDIGTNKNKLKMFTHFIFFCTMGEIRNMS